MSGRRSIDKPGPKTALVRVHFYNGGYQAGLIDVQLYGLRRTSPPAAARLTYAWKDVGKPREFQQVLPAGTREQAFIVPTGPAVVDDFVRISLD